MDQLKQLHAEAVELARQLVIPPDSSASHEGRDPDGAVRIITDGAGRVREVHVSRSWSSHVDPGNLGNAVLDAYLDASGHRIQTWARAVTDTPDRSANADNVVSGRRPQSSRAKYQAKPLLAAGSPGDPASPSAQAAIVALSSLLSGAERALDELAQRVDDRTSQQTVGSSPGQLAAVTLDNGEPIHVDLDQRWLSRTDSAGISQNIRLAFESAYEKQGRVSLDSLVGDGPLGQITAMYRDPEALMRQLGLFGSPKVEQ